MSKEVIIRFVVISIIFVGLESRAFGDIAVSLDPSSYAGGPAAGSNHGWQFTVNDAITVTHLGLFDRSDNGFLIEHPIGLWQMSDSALLASGTMSAGTGDVLIDHFRYIDVPDVDLSIGVDYVVGFYSDTEMMDRMIVEADSLQVNSAINLVVGRWDVAGQFQMPANEVEEIHGEPYYPDRFGPNFQFIPEPATVLLLGLGGLALLRKRRA